MALEEKHRRIAAWLKANPGGHPIKEILAGCGFPCSPQDCSKFGGVFGTLAREGMASKTTLPGKRVLWSADGSGPATVAKVSDRCVLDPWGVEITEEDAQRVIADAVKCYLERPSVRKDPRSYARTAYILGAYMSGRPLPTPQIVQAQSADPVSGSPSSKPLPAGWTTETLAQKIGNAEKKNRLSYAKVAEQTGISEDFLRRYGQGNAYMTDGKAEIIFAAVESVL